MNNIFKRYVGDVLKGGKIIINLPVCARERKNLYNKQKFTSEK